MPKRPKVLKLDLVFPNDSANERPPLRFAPFNTSACPRIGKNTQLKTNQSQITHTPHVMGWRSFAPMLTRESVTFAKRDALQLLICDVQTGNAEFTAILVYDVSRWGRFQDADESGYYEHICKRAGIAIHYAQSNSRMTEVLSWQ